MWLLNLKKQEEMRTEGTQDSSQGQSYGSHHSAAVAPDLQSKPSLPADGNELVRTPALRLCLELLKILTTHLLRQGL